MTDDLLLAIDIGNTSIAIGLYRDDQLHATFRIATDQENLPDEYAMLLLSLLRTRDIAPESVRAAIVSSTVPSLLNTFSEVCRNYFHVVPLIVGTGVRTGVRVRYDNPREIGRGPHSACRGGAREVPAAHHHRRPGDGARVRRSLARG